MPYLEGYDGLYDQAHGYTVNDFAVKLTPGDTSSPGVIVEATFKPGPSDRKNMNEAMAYATISMTVHVGVIGYHEGDAAAITHSYSMAHPEPEMFTPLETPHAPVEKQTADVAAISPDHAARLSESATMVLLTEINFDLYPSMENGYYLRELSCIPEETIGADSLSLLIDGYASNTSLIAYYPMEYEFSATAVVLSLYGPGVSVEQFNEQRAFETGAAIFAITEDTTECADDACLP